VRIDIDQEELDLEFTKPMPPIKRKRRPALMGTYFIKFSSQSSAEAMAH